MNVNHTPYNDTFDSDVLSGAAKSEVPNRTPYARGRALPADVFAQIGMLSRTVAGAVNTVYDAGFVALAVEAHRLYAHRTEPRTLTVKGETVEVPQREGEFHRSVESLCRDLYCRLYRNVTAEHIPPVTAIPSHPSATSTDLTPVNDSWDKAVQPDFATFYERMRKRWQRKITGTWLLDLGPAMPVTELTPTTKSREQYAGKRLALAAPLLDAVDGAERDDPAPVVFGTVCRGSTPLAGDVKALRLLECYEAYRVGLHRCFRSTEAVLNGARSAFIVDAHDWQRRVARDRFDGPATVKVGAYRRNENTDIPDEIRAKRSLVMPYVIFDVDGANVHVSFDTAQLILQRLHAFGADLSHVIVSYTGGEGFHVRVPAGMLGNPVYLDKRTARRVVRHFAEMILNAEESAPTLPETGEKVWGLIDPSLFDPEQHVSVIGSTHRETGRRVVPFTGEQFRTFRNANDLAWHMEAIEDTATPFDLPDPEAAPLAEGLYAALVEAARLVEADGAQTTGYRSRGVVEALLDGVSEGEDWSPEGTAGHVGRNRAAFIYALYLITHGGLNDAGVWGELVRWNRRNDPPLPEHELGGCLKSALRYGQRRGAGRLAVAADGRLV